MKSWIRIRNHIKGKIQKLLRLKIEPWKAADAPNGGLGAQNGTLEGVLVANPHHFDKEQDPKPDPH